MANPTVATWIGPVPSTDKSSRPRRRSIIRAFCLDTSTHALPSIARSQSIHNRLFWSISFLAFLGIMIYFVVVAIMDYFDYPTNIDVSYNSDMQQYFAAFSFCNIASLRFDRFIEPFLNYTDSLRNATTTISSDFGHLTWNFIVDTLNRNETITPYGFSLSSMLHDCSYNFQPCSAADFISFTSAAYGLCHTFNAKLRNRTSDSLRPGNFFGGSGLLSLGLYIHSHQYLTGSSDGAGILALVHDNTQLPLIEQSGVELAPGRRHKLSYRKKRVDFLPSPYTQCTNKLSAPMEAMLRNYDGADYNYSQSICYDICHQSYVYEQCDCVNPYIWNVRWVMVPGTGQILFAPLCDRSNSCFGTASTTLFASKSLLEKYCSDCLPECSITSFTLQTSSSKAYIEWKMDDIKSFVENSSVQLPDDWSTAWREHIHANYLRVNILRETNIVEVNTQAASLGFVDVLSNVGGQTGLWIGISFLSIMEFIEMIYRLIRYQMHSIRAMI